MPAGFFPVVYTDCECYSRSSPDVPFRPYVVARLTNPLTGISTDRRALVDSGADLCAIPVSTAKTLGIDLDQCERSSSQGVGGEVDTYLTELEITACGVSEVCRVLIPMGLASILLGRDPFFRLTHFGFAEVADPAQGHFYWRVP